MTGPQPNNAPDDLTTGKKLQQAREALQLSTGAIARQLRLKLDIIEAIEADRWDCLPPVYLRGHIKNYAHIVGLDPAGFSMPAARSHPVPSIFNPAPVFGNHCP